MRRLAALGLMAMLAVARPAAGASDTLWTVVVVGNREFSLMASDQVGGVPSLNIEPLAQPLSISVERVADGVRIRDAAGADWHLTPGSSVLEGSAGSRPLATPTLITPTGVYLPLDTIATLANRRLLLGERRAYLMLDQPQPVALADARVPSGWQSIAMPKTAAEIAEMHRVEGFENPTAAARAPIKRHLPAANDVLLFDIGAGVAGRSAATDLSMVGGIGNLRLTLNTFLTGGVDGLMFRSGRLTLRQADGAWGLEAGDVLSEIRGVARGARFTKSIGARWSPSIGVYLSDPTVSKTEKAAAVYRDEVRFGPLGFRGEATSDGSAFAAAQWVQGPATLETFWRTSSTRHTEDRGAAVTVNVWKGVGAHLGARVTTGAMPETWYMAGISVPVTNLAMFTLDRTFTEASSRHETDAVGVQVPIGPVRIMQRYEWTDVALVPNATLTGLGYRQLQSVASYAPTRRVRLSYQLATQWSSSAEARQWTELQASIALTDKTSVYTVTGVPDLLDSRRFRTGVQQRLPAGFRLNVEYGELSPFQTPAQQDRPEPARLMVMVRKSFGKATPAGGATVQGRVVDSNGRPVSGAAVTLGPYVTESGDDGSYRFAHVPPGAAALSLDAAGLPARYASDGTVQQLQLARGGRVDVDLATIPLNTVHGHVYLDRNANGRYDQGEGVENVVMRLSTGMTTLTDPNGSYDFYDLSPGQYEVSVDKDRLSRDLEVFPPSAGITVLDSGTSTPGQDFRLVVKQKPIIMQSSRR